MGLADILRDDTVTMQDIADLIEDLLLPVKAYARDGSSRTITSTVYYQIPGSEIAINVRDGDFLLLGYGVQYSHSVGSGMNVIMRVDGNNIDGPISDVTPDSSVAGDRIARSQTFIYASPTPGINTIDLIAATASATAYIKETYVWALSFPTST